MLMSNKTRSRKVLKQNKKKLLCKFLIATSMCKHNIPHPTILYTLVVCGLEIFAMAWTYLMGWDLNV